MKDILGSIKFHRQSEENIGQFSEGLLSLIPDIRGKDILDIGCGSGVIAIAMLKAGAKSSVLNDIDSVYINDSIENCKLNGVYDRTTFIHGCCSAIPSGAMRDVDMIVCNPPQLPSDAMSDAYNNDAQVKSFKAGGRDGFGVIRIIMDKVSGLVSQHTPLYITLSPLLDPAVLHNIARTLDLSASLIGEYPLSLDNDKVQALPEKYRKKLEYPVVPHVQVYKLTLLER